MKLKLLFYLLISFWCFSNSYSQVEVPVYKTVNTFDDVKNYITIEYKSSKQIKIGSRIIKLDELEQEIVKEIKRIEKDNNQFWVSSIRMELIMDKNTSYSQVELLMTELRKKYLLNIIFVCNSEIFSRIDDIWTTGYFFKLNSMKDSKSLIVENSKSSIKNPQNSTPFMPPPPPPPNNEVNLVSLKSGNYAYTVKEVKITNKGEINIDNKVYKKDDTFEQIIKNQIEKEKTAFILQVDDESIYEDWFYPITVIKNTIIEVRSLTSISEYKKDYEYLSGEEKRIIRTKIPHVILFDE